jgi:hypothetical protein
MIKLIHVSALAGTTKDLIPPKTKGLPALTA